MSGNRIDFFKLREITFYEPDIETFRGLKYAYKAIGEGGIMPTVFNAANELAVKDFLSKKIGFTGIYEYIEAAMDEIENIDNPSVEEILNTEAHVYEILKNRFK